MMLLMGRGYVMQNVARAFIRWEWLVLLLLIPVALFPSALSGLLLLIPFFWVLRRIAEGRFVMATPFDVAILGLLIMVGVSFILLFDAAISGPKIGGILLGVALFYGSVAYCRSNGRRLWPVVTLLIVLGVLMAAAGLVGAEWLPPFEALNELRAVLPFGGNIPGTVGGLINANELAGALNWVLPLMLGCLLGLGRRRSTRRAPLIGPLLVATLFTGFVLVATQSRGGILAAAVGLCLTFLFYVSSRWRLVLIIGTFVGVTALYSYSSRTIEQSLLSDPLGFAARAEIWSRALAGIADAPLTGIGVNGFRRVVHALYPLYTVPPEIDLGHAHNHLLQVALDLGLPGLVSYLAIWLLSATLLWQTGRNLVRRHATRHPYYGLVAGLAGSLLAGWVFGIFDTIALGARPAFIWWLLLGLTAALHYAVIYSGERLGRRSRRAASVPLAEPPGLRGPLPTPLRRPLLQPPPSATTPSPGRYSGAARLPDTDTSSSASLQDGRP